MPRTSDRRANERGVALLFVVGGVTALMGLAALSVDIGIGYNTRARINRAADAAVLAAAKVSARGETYMRSVALNVAQSNAPDARFTIDVTARADDVVTVRAEGAETIGTWFGNVLGVRSFDVRAAAEATRFPLDLTLVLDVSSSMSRTSAFDDMQAAAKNFVDAFDEARDQVGIVGFATAGFEVYPIQKNFKTGATAAIDALTTFPDTNIEHGIEVGHRQVLAAPPRAAAGPRRVIMVLFTDGQPTAFTGLHRNVLNNPAVACTGPSTAVAEYYGTLSAYLASTPLIRALAEPDGNANARRIRCFNGGTPEYTADAGGGEQSPTPSALPNGMPVTSDNVREYARSEALTNADSTRRDRITIYTIGLGNPAAANPLEVPDQGLLRTIANQSGATDGSQPQGSFFFAPDASTLNSMFQKVVARILTRVSL